MGITNKDILKTVAIDVPNMKTQLETNMKKSLNTLNVLEFGFKDDGVFDNVALFNILKTQYPNNILYFPYSTLGCYFFGGNRPNLGGIKIKTDNNVVFKVDSNPNLKEMKLLNDVIFNNTTHSTTLEKHQNIQYENVLTNIGSALSDIENNEVYVYEDLTKWLNKIHNTATGDINTDGTAVKTRTKISWSSDFTLNPQLIMPPTIETNTCYEINCLGGSGQKYGMFLQTNSNKIIRLQNIVNTAIWEYVRISPNVVDERINITPPNGGAYGLSENSQQNIQIYYENSKNVYFMVADLTIYHYKGEFGEVQKIGFALSNSPSGTSTFNFVNAIKINNYKYRTHIPLKLCLVGDSISYGAWNSLAPEKILPIMLQNVNGIGSTQVDNISISGSSSVNWASEITKYSFNAYNYVLVMIGTNDIQGNTSITNYIDNIRIIANKIKADGATPVFQIYPIYTTEANSGVVGVSPANYNNHAVYTQALKVFCLENGYEFGNARRNFGANLKWYGDNIHPTEAGQIAILKSWCEVLSRILT